MTDLEDNLREYFTVWKKDGFSKGEQIDAITLSISRILDEVYNVDELAS